ncbi:YfiR family protein [Vibrio sp. TH_r3]|uniref:YfiR family protein n=1 Tax=Vibrio sp. TH_r3 TaxID=3082084 RepID=UPI0029558194|nr:YfiR family protein [Vibrio sp. TH_r3]
MSPTLSMANDREYAVKSGFIYNFARYSEGDWFNPNTAQRYVICSFDPQFVLIAAKTLVSQKVKNRLVEVQLVSQDGISSSHCNTFFFSNQNSYMLSEVLANPNFSKTMLIGESKDFVKSGGHINFFITGGKVRFEVDSYALNKADIKMSSKVLRLGRVIKGNKRD